jgi:hypothetical protein
LEGKVRIRIGEGHMDWRKGREKNGRKGDKYGLERGGGVLERRKGSNRDRKE